MKDKGIMLSNDFWTKPKVKKLQLLKGIFHLAKDASSGNWINVPADAIDVIDSIKIEDKTGKIGWILISRALADALLNLIVENYPTINKTDIITEELDLELDALLETEDFFVDVDFFKHPEKLLIIEKVKPVFTNFLELFNFDTNIIDNILNRYQSYFIFSLINEWRRNYKYYQKFADALITPFDKAAKKENEWFVYSNWLNKQIDRPVFNESFSLKQIYIPLRAYYKVKIQTKSKDKSKRDFIIDEQYNRIVTDLETEMLRWLQKSDKDDAIRIIRGGPGYGKSSFLKMLAAKLSREGKRVLYVPLHLFEVKDDFTIALQNFIKIDGLLNIDPLEEDKLIILFDGLDELSMQGSILTDVANRFLREVERNVTRYNNRINKLQVLISGRDVVVQQNESEFRKDGQILRLLPYYLNDEEKKDLDDKNKLLKVDQRNIWWKKYGQVKGKKYKRLPKALQNKELDEITAQPLLNYLVALSYERGKIKFSSETNLNELYHDLLVAVFDRSYAEGKTLKVIGKFKFTEFARMLEEIATASWHGDGRTTTVKDIEQHFFDSGLKRLLDDFIKDAEKGVISLLAAFYFRQAGQTLSGSQTFEFTHKSFGEYLTAKRIINKIFQIDTKLCEHEICYDDGWNIRFCLMEWIRLFGPKDIDSDLVKFIRNELILMFDNNREKMTKLHETIIKLVNQTLKNGLPMERMDPHPSYKIANEQAINSEKALLIILSLIAQQTDNISAIVWPSKTSFGDWLGRMCQQRVDRNQYILNFLNNLNVNNMKLPLKDLFGSNLNNSSLINVDMQLAILRFAQLMNANLENALLIDIDLQFANLTNAKLKRAHLRGADLRKTNLLKANLEGAVLRGADLRGTYLLEANLLKANLHEANLEGADLRGAHLLEANLLKANLHKANLEGAHLRGADLRSANLQKANLQKAKLQKTKLQGANLQDANLQKANLQEVKLRKAKLRKAKLQGANLQDADLRDARLDGANLKDANLKGANIKNVNFDGAIDYHKNL